MRLHTLHTLYVAYLVFVWALVTAPTVAGLVYVGCRRPRRSA